jgi:SAM-dependent methyltransferase
MMSSDRIGAGGSTALTQTRTSYSDVHGEEQESVPCPVCGAVSERLVVEVQDTMFGRPGKYRLVECERCSMRYINPRPTMSALAAHYPSDYLCYTNFREEPWLLRWAFRQLQEGQTRRRVRHIESVTGELARATHVLDVGCGRGELLGRLKDKRACLGTGIDINPQVVEQVRDQLGIAAVQGTLQDADLPPASFDLITMTEYLEHEGHPRRVLEQARKLAKPGGFIAVEVPDMSGPPGRWFKQNWWQIDAPRHLMFFSPRTLSMALENAGFEIVRVRRYGMLTSMGYSLLQAMGFHYHGSNKLIYLTLSAALGLPFVPILPLLPDFMMIVARAR